MLAIIVRGLKAEAGVGFVTPDGLGQQLGFHRHPAGKVIPPHVHNSIVRNVSQTVEVLVLRQGKLRIDFYTPAQHYLESREVEAGDTVLLASGGHGFEVLEELEMVEMKQGPYAGNLDVSRFTPADDQPPSK